MATWIRRIVSGKKKRFQNEGFDLDLAYISPRIIAMGLPAQGKDVLYRNPLPEIARFLQTYHKGRAKVYNLCSEYQYSADKLSVPLQQYPFDDHQTPALIVVQQFCADAADWLSQHPHNVVVVHCKAGKGRTGLMICSFLMYLHKNAPDLGNLPPQSAAESVLGTAASPSPDAALHLSKGVDSKVVQANAAVNKQGSAAERLASFFKMKAEQHEDVNSSSHPWQFVEPVQLQQLARPVHDVLALYAERRTHDGNGVTIPSQRRYVEYSWSVLLGGPEPCGVLPPARTLQLRQLVIAGLPPGTAEGCSVVVEARPSGSTAASASTVWVSPATKALAGNKSGLHLCMVPCSLPPQVSEDACSTLISPAGDRLTINLPAASLGLSLLSSAATAAAEQAPDPVTEAAGVLEPDVDIDSPFATAIALTSAVDDSDLPCSLVEGSLAADSYPYSDAAELSGCCVVEGDVRITVLRGGTKLFFTWFNTAFMPGNGSYTLPATQLDKMAKNLPRSLTVSVKYVDLQPQAGHEGSTAAAGEAAHDELVSEPGDTYIPQSVLYRSTSLKDDTPGRIHIRSSSRSSLDYSISSQASDLLKVGNSVSAPASPLGSAVARAAASWLQFPALLSMGSMPPPLQRIAGGSSSGNLGEADNSSKGVPGASGNFTGADRQQKDAGRKLQSRLAGSMSLPANYDSQELHFFDWDWGSMAAEAAAAAPESAEQAEPAAALADVASRDQQQQQHIRQRRQQRRREARSQKRQQQQQADVATGIELPALKRPSTPAITAAATAVTVGNGVGHHQQHEIQDQLFIEHEEVEDDGGDLFVSDLYGAPDALDILLQAPSLAAAPGVVLGAHDPLQGFFESWHWSLDRRSSSRKRHQRRHTVADSTGYASTSTSGANTPRAGVHVESQSLARAQSLPACAPTPPLAGAASNSISCDHISGLYPKATNVKSPFSAAQASGVVAAAEMLRDSIVNTRCIQVLEAVAEAPVPAAIDVKIAPLTPPLVTPKAPDVDLSSVATAPGWRLAGAGDSGMLGFGMLPSQCATPTAVTPEARTELPRSAFSLLEQETEESSAFLFGSAPAAAVGGLIRAQSSPDSCAVAAVADAASCVVTVAGPAAGATPSASAAFKAADDAEAARCAASEQKGCMCNSLVTAGGASAAVSQVGIDASYTDASFKAASSDVECSSCSKHSTDSKVRGLVCKIHASAASATPSWPAVDNSSAAPAADVTAADDQRQSLLNPGHHSSSAAVVPEGESNTRRSVASLVQQWQQLEKAWQRNWV